MLVYIAGSGTHVFTLNEDTYVLSSENIALPPQGPYYSVNEGNTPDFPTIFSTYIDALRAGSLLGTKYGARYIGSFIADLHRTLLKGGVFLYPPTAKSPYGKLRLLYEANPLSFLVEQAGGRAISGPANNQPSQRVLDLQPSSLHQRTSLIIGGSAEVDAFSALAAASSAA